MRLTVWFDGQFWCGLFEESGPAGPLFYRHVFGGEPSEREILSVTRRMPLGLLKAAPRVASDRPPPVAANPKRRAREAARALSQQGIGRRSLDALKEIREREAAAARAERRREQALREEELRAARKERAKKRHRGH